MKANHNKDALAFPPPDVVVNISISKNESKSQQTAARMLTAIKLW